MLLELKTGGKREIAGILLEPGLNDLSQEKQEKLDEFAEDAQFKALKAQGLIYHIGSPNQSQEPTKDDQKHAKELESLNAKIAKLEEANSGQQAAFDKKLEAVEEEAAKKLESVKADQAKKQQALEKEAAEKQQALEMKVRNLEAKKAELEKNFQKFKNKQGK